MNVRLQRWFMPWRWSFFHWCVAMFAGIILYLLGFFVTLSVFAARDKDAMDVALFRIAYAPLISLLY